MLNNNVIYGKIENLYGWTCVRAGNTEIRATARSLHEGNQLIMDPLSVPATPYKFQANLINVVHAPGEIVLVNYQDKFMLAVVKNDLCEERPLDLLLTVMISLKRNSDDSYSGDFEDIYLSPWSGFIKAVHTFFVYDSPVINFY